MTASQLRGPTLAQKFLKGLWVGFAVVTVALLVSAVLFFFQYSSAEANRAFVFRRASNWFSSLQRSASVLTRTRRSPQTFSALRLSKNAPLGQSKRADGISESVKIFVYDNYTTWTQDTLDQHARVGRKGIDSYHSRFWKYRGEEWLFQQLLQSNYRTLDPDQADFFYFPLFSAAQYAITGEKPQEWALFLYGIKSTLDELHYFQRNQGRDFLYYFSHDYGPCLTSARNQAASVRLPDWLLRGTVLTTLGDKHMPSCFRPSTDIVLPPAVREEFALSALESRQEARRAIRQSKHMRVRDPPSAPAAPASPALAAVASAIASPPLPSTSSQLPQPQTQPPSSSDVGVSYVMIEPKRNYLLYLDSVAAESARTRLPVVSIRNVMQKAEFAVQQSPTLLKSLAPSSPLSSPADGSLLEPPVETLLNTEFCLVTASNVPWSPRFVEAALTGCIPVFANDDLILPFTAQLNWPAASLSVPEANLTHIARILSSVSDGQKDRMRSELTRIAPSLVLSPLSKAAVKRTSQRFDRPHGTPLDLLASVLKERRRGSAPK